MDENKPVHIDITKPMQKIDKCERYKCQICSGTERYNVQKKPEIFVSCSSCKGNGKLNDNCMNILHDIILKLNFQTLNYL